jgi:hypothetical protein
MQELSHACVMFFLSETHNFKFLNPAINYDKVNDKCPMRLSDPRIFSERSGGNTVHEFKNSLV